MTAALHMYVKILEQTLLHFLKTTFLDVHLFQQGNDPKCTSKVVEQWFVTDHNWWKTPAESQDMNPIENLWHELKEYICCVVKSDTTDEHVKGTLCHSCLGNMDVNKCQCYILHLRKVTHHVINQGSLQDFLKGYCLMLGLHCSPTVTVNLEIFIVKVFSTVGLLDYKSEA